MQEVISFHFDGAWCEGGWIEPAYIGCDQEGRITRISSQAPEGSVERVHGYALPGFVNAHSHAFQYAMAGTVEHLPPNAAGDNFWSWRETMYGLASQITPDTMEAIASMLYADLLRVGYTHVVEFHYLHHDPQGQPYDNLVEMGERLVSAAATAGIGITLVPIFYQKGGFQQLPSPRQHRFLSHTYDDYCKLWQATADMVAKHPHANVGVGVHSLRAVQADDVLRTFTELDPQAPRHIHVSEQLQEVDDCLVALGVRPVQWLLNHVPLDHTYHLVHATHTTEQELQELGQCGAHVVLCPTTEGNLGDGRFDLVTYRKHQGRWSIGTDSHISLFPQEDLRLLDYGQRIARHQRNILCQQPGEHSGELAFQEALQGGLHAIGQGERKPYFTPGQPLDAVVYDAQTPLLSTTSAPYRMSTIIYALDAAAIQGTLVQGKWVTQNHRHIRHDQLLSKFQDAVGKLQCRTLNK